MSVNSTDILQIKICKQDLNTDLLHLSNSENCLELHQYFPLQNYESEITFIFAIKVFAVIIMTILMANFVKQLVRNGTVFPFISLIFTPLIVLHVFTLNAKPAQTVKLQLKALSQILTYDFFNIKSSSSRKGKAPKTISQLWLIGYKFVSLGGNMGIVFWVLVVFGGFLGCEMVLFALKFTTSKLKKSSKLHKYIQLQHNLYSILSNYLAVHHVIQLTSLTLYLLNACFSLKCLFSDETISATKLVKLDIILSILLIIGLFHHFFRILILVQRHNWLGL